MADRRKMPAVLLGIAIGAAVLWGAGLGGAVSASEPLPEGALEELLQRVAAGTELPVGTSFRQQVTLRALFTTWRFESLVTREPDGYRTETRGAPSFVPDSLPSDLVNLMQSIYLFDLRPLDAAEPGLVVLAGRRIDYRGAGPSEATFWIDAERGVVERAQAVYSWGTLHVSQEYLERGGRLLLSRQMARAAPYGFTLEVDYLDYAIP